MRQGQKSTLIAGPVSLDTPNGVQRINVSSAIQMLTDQFANARTRAVIFSSRQPQWQITAWQKLQNTKLKNQAMS